MVRIQANDFIFQIFNWPKRTAINRRPTARLNAYRLTQTLTVGRLNSNITFLHPFDAQEGLQSIRETPLTAPLLIFLVGECCELLVRC